MTRSTPEPASSWSDGVLPEHVANVAINDPAHLKAWLLETNRHWLVLRATEIVDALPWPSGVEALIGVLECLRSHRGAETVDLPDGTSRSKTDVLELDEMKEAAAWLAGLIREKDPTWTP